MKIILALCFLIFSSLQDVVASGELLISGDMIDVVYPSGTMLLKEGKTIEDLQAALEGVADEDGTPFGLRVNLHAEDINPALSYVGYYSNSDENRATSFLKIFLNPQTKAIWFGRGGFGGIETMVHIQSQLRDFIMPNRVPPIFGFSDATVFHMWMHNLGKPSYYGPMANILKETVDISGITSVNAGTSGAQTMNILMGRITEVRHEVRVLNADQLQADKFGEFTTTIHGGCLSIIHRNDSVPNIKLNRDKLRNAVLLFEDTSEDKKRARSLLTSMAAAGMFSEVKAIFFGNYPMADGTSPEEVFLSFDRDILRNVYHLDIPIFYSNRVGHGEFNDVVPLGTIVGLEVKHDGTATLNCNTNQSAY